MLALIYHSLAYLLTNLLWTHIYTLLPQIYSKTWHRLYTCIGVDSVVPNIRDVNETLRSETETFGFQPETRPRPRRSHISQRPRRWENASRDQDVEIVTTSLHPIVSAWMGDRLRYVTSHQGRWGMRGEGKEKEEEEEKEGREIPQIFHQHVAVNIGLHVTAVSVWCGPMILYLLLLLLLLVPWFKNRRGQLWDSSTSRDPAHGVTPVVQCCCPWPWSLPLSCPRGQILSPWPWPWPWAKVLGLGQTGP